MSLKMISLNDCKVTITDGTAVTPKSVELAVGSGNLQFTEAKGYIYPKDRGTILACLDDDEIPLEVSFSFIFGDMLSATGGTPYTSPRDIIKGGTSGGVTYASVADACQAYAVDITIEPDEVTECDIAEKITLPSFSYTSLSYDPDKREISCSGTCTTSRATFTKIVEA